MGGHVGLCNLERKRSQTAVTAGYCQINIVDGRVLIFFVKIVKIGGIETPDTDQGRGCSVMMIITTVLAPGPA